MKRLRESGGQAMIEYALTAMIFFSMVFFIIDGGRILWNYITVAEVARVGARYGMTHGSLSTSALSPGNYEALRNLVKERAVGLDPDKLTVTAAWHPDNNVGSDITVVVVYEAESLSQLFWPNQVIPLRGQSTMTIQN